jgi:hypothetical protein
LLDTVAGKGDTPTKACNGRSEDFERGDALDAELSRPHLTMADAAGNLYIADKDAHPVRKVDTGGVITTLAGTGSRGEDGDDPRDGVGARLSSPNGLWDHADGTIYLHDMGNDEVCKLTPNGELTTLFGTLDSSTGRGLWVSDEEDLAYIFCVCSESPGPSERSAQSRLFSSSPSQPSPQFSQIRSSGLLSAIVDDDSVYAELSQNTPPPSNVATLSSMISALNFRLSLS